MIFIKWKVKYVSLIGFIPLRVLNKNNANAKCRAFFFRNISSLRVFENKCLRRILEPKGEKRIKRQRNE
jgi:hypothetical protein